MAAKRGKFSQQFDELRAFAPRLPVKHRAAFLRKLWELERSLTTRTQAASNKRSANSQPTYDAVAALTEALPRPHSSWSSWAVATWIEKDVNAGRRHPLSRHTIREYVERYRTAQITPVSCGTDELGEEFFTLGKTLHIPSAKSLRKMGLNPIRYYRRRNT